VPVTRAISTDILHFPARVLVIQAARGGYRDMTATDCRRIALSFDGAEQGSHMGAVDDPASYAASLLIIVTSCVLAVSVPALRAARIDPIATLRKD
jgi:hypothetical protein